MALEIARWSIQFIIALIALLKVADWFTASAEKIGLHFKIPQFIIGVTIVALGTSLPEIATSIISVMQGHSEIVIGNVIGSNVANILFVLGITAIVGKHLTVDKDIINIDLPLMMGSAILLFITTLDGSFDYKDGIISILFLATYIIYNMKAPRDIDEKNKKDLAKLEKELKNENVNKPKEKRKKLGPKQPLILLVTSIGIYFTADWTIQSVVEISKILKIGTEIVAMSVVALGTSLPELTVSIVAAKKGKADLAIGNVTGSNIFNALGVMGVPALIGTLQIPEQALTFGIPALLLVTILYIFTTMDKQISQWEGITMILLYIAFMGKTIGII